LKQPCVMFLSNMNLIITLHSKRWWTYVVILSENHFTPPPSDSRLSPTQVGQLSVTATSLCSFTTVKMIIYNSTQSILIQFIRVMIVRWQSDLVNTKENILSVCDKPYHTKKVERRGDWSYAGMCIKIVIMSY